MVYIMMVQVDGGCRRNGQQGAVGAASAIFVGKDGQPSETWAYRLPEYPNPTNQRAELTAIIIALKQALQKYDGRNTHPNLDLTVLSDSKYAIGCMNSWIHKWSRKGWINSAGNGVANQDLLKEAYDLEKNLREKGTVAYRWIPRAQNKAADEACKRAMAS
jgi:ribonuclease HI